MVARVVHRLLGAPDGDGRFAGNLARALQGGSQRRLGRGQHGVDQAVLQSLLGAHAPAGVGQLFDHGQRNELGQALQGAHVGHHADVDFLDAEEGLGTCVTQAAGGDHVHGAANAAALDGRNHRNAQFLQLGKRGLHVRKRVKHGGAPLGALVVHLDGAGKRVQRHARAEVLAGAADHQHARAVAVVQFGQRRVKLAPEHRAHGVERVGLAQHQVGDMVFNRQGKAVHWGHGVGSPKWCW